MKILKGGYMSVLFFIGAAAILLIGVVYTNSSSDSEAKLASAEQEEKAIKKLEKKIDDLSSQVTELKMSQNTIAEKASEMISNQIGNMHFDIKNLKDYHFILKSRVDSLNNKVLARGKEVKIVITRPVPVEVARPQDLSPKKSFLEKAGVK